MAKNKLNPPPAPDEIEVVNAGDGGVVEVPVDAPEPVNEYRAAFMEKYYGKGSAEAENE